MQDSDQYNNKIGAILTSMDKLLSNNHHHIVNNDQYNQLCRFQRIQWNETLLEQSQQFASFCQNKHKRILFICGPSGCGKTELVTKMLNNNGIQFEWAHEQFKEGFNDTKIYEGISHMITRYFRSSVSWKEQIILFKDFPIVHDEMPNETALKIRQFKAEVYNIISNLTFNMNKYIFILNSQIYSPFYILNEASHQKCLANLKNVSVIKMKAYGIKKMKSIIQNFKNNHMEYGSLLNNAITIDEIITEACGDARKALHLIYHKRLLEEAYVIQMNVRIPQYKAILFDQSAMSIEKSTSKSKSKNIGTKGFFFTVKPKLQKSQEGMKMGVYNTLGKFLYDFNKDKKQNKTNNSRSRHYTQQQILKYNPKFYFKPLQLFQKSHLSFQVFTELLIQNFLNRYGSVKDISKMYDIFRYSDQENYSFEMQEQKKYLITWGIVVYNLNCDKTNTSFLIQRSKGLILAKTLKQKAQLLKQYYIRYKDGVYVTKYTLKDIIRYAYLIQKSWNSYRHRYLVFYQQLVSIVFNNQKKNAFYSQVDAEIMTIQDEDDEIALEQTQRLHKIQDKLTKQIIGKIKDQKKMQSIIDDQSDIDSN